MTDIGSMFPGKFLKSSDLQGKKIKLQISGVVKETVGDDEKPVVYFEGKEKGLVLNVTNGNTIKNILGTGEIEEWEGKEITLYPTKTEYAGKRVDCIRVEDEEPTVEAATDGEIPF